MFQRCVATVFASTGAAVGRDPASFVTAPQASADPAASMVSLNPSPEIALHFSSFFITVILLMWTKRFIDFIWSRWSLWTWISHLQSALNSSTSCHSCICSVKCGFKLWKDFADLFKPIPRCHSIKNTFLAIWLPEHPRWTLSERSFSPWVAENLLTSAFGFSTSSSTILSVAPLLNWSCWSKPVKDSVVFLIIPHDRKFLSVSTHPCLSLKLDPSRGHMKTPGLFSEWVSGCWAATFSLMRYSGALSSWHIWPYGHIPVGGSICLKSNRLKHSTDSPSMPGLLLITSRTNESLSSMIIQALGGAA